MAKGRKTGGRRLGSLNKATVEVKAACAELVDDPEYRRSLARRLHSGTVRCCASRAPFNTDSIRFPKGETAHEHE
jgi:hypothetical protein